MSKVKAVTHHHPLFLKAAYKADAVVDLINDESHLAIGDRYIGFDSGRESFAVYVKTTCGPMRVRAFDNLASAVNCARRKKP